MNEVIDKEFGEEAHKYHQAVLRVTVEIKKNLWDLAIVLKHLRDNKLYTFYNDTWEAYLASLNSSISRSFAHKLITNFEIWVEELDVSPDKLQNIDTEKLYIAGSMANKDNYEEALEQARTLSRSDLRQLKSGHEYEPRYKIVTCPKCGEEFKVML